MRETFPLCLRSSAIAWHTAELTAIKREFFTTATPIETICNTLIHKFKEPTSTAFKTLLISKYTLSDVRAGYTLRSYILSGLRLARSASFKGWHCLLVL
jgi:hypothetical protein